MPRPLVVTHGPRDGDAVALTFDDGPGAVTEAVLEALAAAGARATFDVLGDRVAGRESVLRRILAEGHELGNHGLHHVDHRRRPLAAARGVARTCAAVRAATGTSPRVFRAPFGLVNRRLVLAVRLAGCATVGWDVDPRDHEEPGAATIRGRVLAAVRPGSIVLLHDDRPELAPTAEALDGILAELRGRGLRAVGVSELLGW
jgi:peptidoglycan/xylan/chitin deacetylase (PgdA/CDA1 family)